MSVPITTHLDDNRKGFLELAGIVKDLPRKLAKPLSDQSLPGTNALKILIDSAQKLADQLQVTSNKFSNVSSPPPPTSSKPPLLPTPRTVPTMSQDRRANILIFGLAENNSLQETKVEVDRMFQFLLGRNIPIIDAFRLGRHNQQPGSSTQARPRPLLVKLSSVWDKRLVISCKYKLKGYPTPNLYIHEDLPLEVRKARALARKVSPPPRSRCGFESSSSSGYSQDRRQFDDGANGGSGLENDQEFQDPQ